MRQGATRHERAHNYVRAGHAAADALGARCAWTVINVPDVGHDGERMSVDCPRRRLWQPHCTHRKKIGQLAAVFHA